MRKGPLDEGKGWTSRTDTTVEKKRGKDNKILPLPPCRRQEGEREEVQLILELALGGVSGQHRTATALYSRGKDPRYQLDRRLGGPQSWSRHRS
jgi:hypothetical protein